MAGKPLIDIPKPLPSINEQFKKEERQSSEKLILIKNNVTSSVIHMLDQVIDILLQVDNLNVDLLQSKFAFKTFANLRNKVAKS